MVKKNLALKLSTSKALTSADSDLGVAPDTVTSWTPKQSTSTSVFNSSDNNGQYSMNNGNGYETYYQWNAATAGSGSGLTAGQNATRSICAKGWRLPTGGYNAGEFWELMTAYGYTNGGQMVAAPMLWQYGGRVGSGSLAYGGSSGRYWSSMADSSGNAYLLYFNSSSIDPSDNFDRYYGMSVRCIAR